jgi:hypothetical protein
MIEEEIR